MMKEYLQNLFGISDLKKSNEDLQKITEDYRNQVEKLTSKLAEENSTKAYATKLLQEQSEFQKWFSTIQETQKMELSVIDEKLSQLLPQKLDVENLEVLKEIEFIADQKLNMVDLSQLNRKIEGATLISKNDAAEGLISNLLAGFVSAGIAKFITKGLYTTTAKPEQLIQYASGTFSSITSNGSKFGKHVGFTQAGFMSMAPLLAFQAASMVTSQIHMQHINRKLSKINEKVGYLFDFHKNERTAKLKYINQKINEYFSRDYFTTEDFVMMDQFKYDLLVMQEEGAQFFVNTLVDKFQALGINIDSSYELAVVAKDKKSIWKKLEEKGNNLNQNLGNFVEKSKSHIEKTIQGFQDSQIFFYAEVSITAEKLYENLLLAELAANLKVKELDRDRIGKIDELRRNVEQHNIKEKSSKLIGEFYKKFEIGFGSFVAQKRKSAFERNQSEIGIMLQKFEKELSILKNLLELESDSKHLNNFANEFYDDYEIIIDNTGEQELVYMKRLNV
ncbi:hypothetical protein SAMN05660493_01339 [Epilithonimonas bovis DSM 19482]|uniref:Uncharacterized protein n=1 Tax=Epilithonimonas bovis DSM 19482 TaxID=1121284 RepID=A0A1U7PY03_9FLAO|nr:hypothetical protein [Epilithonimonas bovis]SIT96648.1 hypothetical protein SAMN05660493_01339 [Epilithonimonas bovis DSM 19482]